MLTLALVLLGAEAGAGHAASALSGRDAVTAGWPGFRGGHRDGISRETGLLDNWPEDGPRVLWRVAAGAGYSGVSIDGDRAFTLWQQDDTQQLVALDVADGRVLWRHVLGPGFASPYGDGPRATPVIDEGRVFAIDANGHLAAVRAGDGQRIWSHDLGEDFGARIPSIGFTSTPLVEGDRLIVEVGARQRAFMAFDTATGEVLWSSQSDEPAYSSPIALTSGDRRQVVFWSASGLHALAPEDGHLLWRYSWPSPCPATGIPLNSATPVFIPPDRFFVSSAYGDQRGAGVLRLVERQDRLAVEELWHTLIIESTTSSAVLVGDHLYGFKGGILVSVEAATGALNWSARGFKRGSLISADGKLIVLGEDGRLSLIEAIPDEYRELASTQILEGRSWTAPSLAGGRLFVRNGEEVVSVELAGER